MSKVAVVYWSGTGNTEQMANAVGEGAKQSGAQVSLFSANEFNSDMVDDFSAIAFGCPAMGAEGLEENEFEPMFKGCEGKLPGKTVGLFGSYGWGGGEWMERWMNNCRGLNAKLAGGVISCGAPDSEVIGQCNTLGKALAK